MARRMIVRCVVSLSVVSAHGLQLAGVTDRAQVFGNRFLHRASFSRAVASRQTVSPSAAW